MTKLKRSQAIFFLPATLLFIGLAAPKLEADVIWNYSGTVTDDCILGPCSDGSLLIDTLNLTITFSGSQLADNLNSVDLNAASDIISWTLSDTQGYIDFSSTDAGDAVYDSFTTNAGGNITPNTYFTVLGPNYGLPDSVGAAVSSCEEGYCDEVFVYDQEQTFSAVEADSDGVWSSSPEPSTTLLMATGGGILLLALRRKYRLSIEVLGRSRLLREGAAQKALSQQGFTQMTKDN